jgi:hypothetical protein
MGLFGTQALLGSRTSFRIDTFRAAPEARGLSAAIIEGYRGAKPADQPATTAVGSAKGAGGSATTAGELAKDAVGVATSAVSFATSAVGLAEASVEAAEGGGELSMSAGELADAAGEFATSAVGPAKAHPTIFLECADLSAL